MNSSRRSPGLLFRYSLMNSSIRIGTKPIAQPLSLASTDAWSPAIHARFFSNAAFRNLETIPGFLNSRPPKSYPGVSGCRPDGESRGLNISRLVPSLSCARSVRPWAVRAKASSNGLFTGSAAAIKRRLRLANVPRRIAGIRPGPILIHSADSIFLVCCQLATHKGWGVHACRSRSSERQVSELVDRFSRGVDGVGNLLDLLRLHVLSRNTRHHGTPQVHERLHDFRRSATLEAPSCFLQARKQLTDLGLVGLKVR